MVLPAVLIAQPQQSFPSVPTFRVTSSLVYLDVTVLDKKGRLVTSGLTRDDFTITEDKKPQRIFSFEAPAAHTLAADQSNASGQAPVTIFVLDLLNSDFSDFAYIRYSMESYLNAQPAQLPAPAEMMVIGNQSMEMIQGYTRSRKDLLFALKHLPAVLPYKKMNTSFFAERFDQSLDALQQIALQNKGVPGRKNVIWVGHGGPSINSAFLPGDFAEKLDRYVHAAANMLVDARITLYVIYPGLPVNSPGFGSSAMSAEADPGDTDPFAGDINFGVFVNETGGKLTYNRNDVDMQIAESQHLGSQYYTLTYQPAAGEPDGKFRRIRVTLRDPNLHAVTKTGYFAPDKKIPIDPREQAVLNMMEAARATIPFDGLIMQSARVVRHPDSRSATVSVLLRGKNLDWEVGDDGKTTAHVQLAAFALNGRRDILASRLTKLALISPSGDPARLPTSEAQVKVNLRLPRQTQSIRVVIQTVAGGRIGTSDIDRKTIQAAPEQPTPEPQLVPSRQPSAKPAS
ncbi:MAG TPA: VWA domain-containing protein [Acidobacteriaceae bacterium]|nr:VWA domain-containing protein [Acidobacteriaceae bacterium]